MAKRTRQAAGTANGAEPDSTGTGAESGGGEQPKKKRERKVQPTIYAVEQKRTLIDPDVRGDGPESTNGVEAWVQLHQTKDARTFSDLYGWIEENGKAGGTYRVVVLRGTERTLVQQLKLA